ncbi:MAG: methyltransferase domain-containing protein [Helicobacteraceae bacterium]|jgi:SAM-dependent methyltransferase|nr:methyltransferase domain-containing protein [Helicobacteraceae bacterium]
MLAITNTLSTELEGQSDIAFEVLNPDLYSGAYAGKEVSPKGTTYLYRALRSWLDLAANLNCRMLTPTIATEQTIVLHFQKLEAHSFHEENPQQKSEKYGVGSSFFAINKNEEPAFLSAYTQALYIADIASKKRVLNLGVNRGDEFSLLQELLGDECFKQIEFVGIDHSESAIVEAKNRFTTPNMHFYSHDINALDELDLGTFDLIITVGTLQSPGINYKPFLMNLVQNYLSDDGALILGFPNSRWIDGEMVYGAKMRNFRESDLSLLLSDVDYAKRYLQQKKFTVRISGKEYIFLTATSNR